MTSSSARPTGGRLVLAALASLLLAGAGFAPPEEAQDVVASRSGFKPDVLNARKGETLRLRLTSADQEHCFAIDAFRVEKRVVAGRATAVDVTPDRAGTFEFHCCLETGQAAEKEKGRIVVAE